MYWENLQQMQEGATSAPEYNYPSYAEPQTTIAETPLPALKDVWPPQQNTKKNKKVPYQGEQAPSLVSTNVTAQYDSYAVPTNVPATYTTQNYVYGNDTAHNYERNDDHQDVEFMYVDGRPVTITTNETSHDDPIRETHITEVEITSPDYIDYSRLGPSAKDIVVDGKALLDGFSSVLNQMHNNYEALKTDSNNGNSETSTSEVCQMQIDGLPLSQLFQSFLPHLQNGGGQKMMEQLSAQLSREKCMSFLQNMQQQQQQQQHYAASANYQVLPGQNKNDEKTREEVSLSDLHETAETLIKLAKYPVEKKAVVVEMIPQAGTAVSNQQQSYVYPQNDSSNAHTGYVATPQAESYPVDQFEFTKEDKELMAICSGQMDAKEAESIEKLISETFQNVEKTKFISDEVAAAIPDIQRKFLVSAPVYRALSLLRYSHQIFASRGSNQKRADLFKKTYFSFFQLRLKSTM